MSGPVSVSVLFFWAKKPDWTRLSSTSGKPSSSSMGKDTPKKEKKQPFSWKSSGSAKDVQLQAGAEEDEVEGMRVDLNLVIVLKFIVSIVLNIEVDSTTSF